ncbi:MAG: efflux RND transporter periplasmic adaptor subunit [Tannerellaceae bacterium]
MKKIYVLWALCAYVVAGCSGNTPAAGGEHDHEHEHEHEDGHAHGPEAAAAPAAAAAHADEILFTPAMAEAIGLKTKVMAPASFTDVIQTSGRILAAQGDESVVVATVPGVVRFGSLSFIDGAAVRKGQTLLSLSSSGLSDGDVATRARLAYETARKEYERMQLLVGDKIVSAKDFEQVRLSYENARVAYEAVAGKQTAKGVSVVSPLNGYLKNLQVKEGDFVAVGQPLATISQNSRLMLRADVSEKYYASLSAIRSANFRTPYDKVLYELDDLRGRLISYGKASDTNSFYIPVTFEFDNKGAVIPGSFVEIYLLASPLQNVLSVPVSAIVEEQGLYFVYLRLDEEGYKKQEVTPGANNGAEVQILSGLKAGDTVVTKGAYQVKLASASHAIPAHSHQH